MFASWRRLRINRERICWLEIRADCFKNSSEVPKSMFHGFFFLLTNRYTAGH